MIDKVYEELRQFAIKHKVCVVTATQPYRPGPGLTPEEILELSKLPIIIDYIGIMR